MSWKIYYDTGEVFTSEDGPFEEAPSDGVICIVRKDGERTEFHSGSDFYLRFDDDGTIATSDDLGPILRKLGFIKFGRGTSHKKFEAIMNRARNEAKG